MTNATYDYCHFQNAPIILSIMIAQKYVLKGGNEFHYCNCIFHFNDVILTVLLPLQNYSTSR